ncbi:MAG: hypothetical protein A2Y15_03540 [Clostridiales bacterium GWF2_36_10]|nr:MAG: hypothetical protein A2Y15_03540 [Clostridiales bacterium GWF2_36_10]HAN20303.1 hypothetical protein [Clostridiales bacterium]
MLKKILVLVIIFSLVFTFASCNGDNDNNDINKEDTSSTVSVVSETSSQEVSEEVSVESSEEISNVSEEVSTGVVEGVYYGEGYSFTVPEGFVFTSNNSGSVNFTNTTSGLNISSEVNALKLTTMTKKQIEGTVSALLDDIEFTEFEFETVTIDGQNAVYFMFTMEVGIIKVNSYSTMIFTDENIYTVTLAANGDDMKVLFDETMSSFTIQE